MFYDELNEIDQILQTCIQRNWPMPCPSGLAPLTKNAVLWACVASTLTITKMAFCGVVRPCLTKQSVIHTLYTLWADRGPHNRAWSKAEGSNFTPAVDKHSVTGTEGGKHWTWACNRHWSNTGRPTERCSHACLYGRYEIRPGGRRSRCHRTMLNM